MEDNRLIDKIIDMKLGALIFDKKINTLHEDKKRNDAIYSTKYHKQFDRTIIRGFTSKKNIENITKCLINECRPIVRTRILYDSWDQELQWDVITTGIVRFIETLENNKVKIKDNIIVDPKSFSYTKLTTYLYQIFVNVYSELKKEGEKGGFVMAPGDREITINTGDVVQDDGIIIRGECELDESFILGDTTPIKKSKRNKVYKDSRVLSGKATLKIKRSLPRGPNDLPDIEYNASDEIKKLFGEDEESRIEKLRDAKRRALELLTKQCKQIIELRFNECKSHPQIAKKLDMSSVNVSKTTLSRCMNKLRELSNTFL